MHTDDSIITSLFSLWSQWLVKLGSGQAYTPGKTSQKIISCCRQMFSQLSTVYSDHSVGQSVSQSLKQSVRKAGSQSASQSVNQAGSQSVRQAGRQPVCQLGRLASKHACRQAVSQSGRARQASSHSVSQSVRQTGSQSVSQSVSSQADGQSVSHSSSEVSTGTDELSLFTNSP